MTATMVKERPILFSGPMVRAIIEGRKTQTRRPVRFKRMPHLSVIAMTGHSGFKDEPENTQRWSADHQGKGSICVEQDIKCPYGLTGDRLWVRETWGAIKNYDTYAPSKIPKGSAIGFKTDDIGRWCQTGCGGAAGKWRPSIHMPRWASRITLEITNVRCERLHHMSMSDLGREGYQKNGAEYVQFLRSFAAIYNLPEKEMADPWVWVIEFRRIP